MQIRVFSSIKPTIFQAKHKLPPNLKQYIYRGEVALFCLFFFPQHTCLVPKHKTEHYGSSKEDALSGKEAKKNILV